ncbi:MAG: hypothetical protein NXI10_17615 [bacterium]|nr:hypothetical protein [bacterium]
MNRALINRNYNKSIVLIGFFILSAGLFLSACKSSNAAVTEATETQVMNGDHLELAHKLENEAYGEMYVYPIHNRTIDAIWSDTTNHVLLYQIIEDKDCSGKAKFLACEVLHAKDTKKYMTSFYLKEIADIYADALIHNYTGKTNPWGLLYRHDDAGECGAMFLILGESAIPTLIQLLDNESVVTNYHGSSEATVGNGYKFRVKDFAAFYLGQIIHEPLEYYDDYEDRDAQIEHLKKKLKERNK